MNLYEMIKKNGSGKGEDMMWKAVGIISSAVESDMSEKDRNALMRKIYGAMSNGHYNEEFATEDVSKMYYTDSSKEKQYAPYWTVSQVKDAYESVKASIPKSYGFWDFYVTLQMQKSDLMSLYHSWFPDETKEQLDKRFIESAVNWLNDADNPYGDEKIWGYLNR